MRVTIGAAAVVLLLAACSADAAEPATTATSSAPSLTTLPPPTTTTPAPVTTVVETTMATTSTATTSTTTTTTEPPPELLGVELEPVTEIHRPLAIAAPAGDDRLFVAQREGIVAVVGPTGEIAAEPFLDITDRVWANGIEQGLLGLAFHPEFADNGRFYVYYTDGNDDTRLVEFTAGDDRTTTDPTTARELLFIDQPTNRHNAGMLQFGPDGYLYVAVGDGGDGGGNAQNLDNVFGSILRIDVDDGEPYAIPDDNPFASGGGAGEIWAYGFRNPWRFSIDPESGLIFIGDVGQESWEEIDVLSLDAAGSNLGWAYMEGNHCFSSPECTETESVPPVIEYPHSEGCSVTGGHVYRGSAIPELHGVYFYADWCFGWVRSFRFEDGEAVDIQNWSELDPGQVTTFGIDGFGELYVGTWGGMVWKLVPIRAEE